MNKTLLLAGLLALAPSAFGAAAGNVTMQTGSGTALGADGTVRRLASGDPVNSGETLVTGPNSYLGVKFTDGGSIVLRPDSRFQIENYAYPSAQPAPSAAPAPVAPAAAAAASADTRPRITSVSPAVPKPGMGKQAFSIAGANFKPGAKLELTETQSGQVFHERVPDATAANKIDRSTNFGPRTTKWTVVVINPDGTRSAPFEFGVGMEVAAVPQLAPAAPVAAAPAPVAPATPATAPVVVAAAGEQNAAFRLLRGGFRAVSGAIGSVRKSDYKVSTSVATIGIRGTDYYVYICDAACADDPTVAASAGITGKPEGGLLLGVIKGGIFTANAGGEVTSELPQGKYEMVLPDGGVVSLPVEPRFLRVDPIPDPKNCK